MPGNALCRHVTHSPSSFDGAKYISILHTSIHIPNRVASSPALGYITQFQSTVYTYEFRWNCATKNVGKKEKERKRTFLQMIDTLKLIGLETTSSAIDDDDALHWTPHGDTYRRAKMYKMWFEAMAENERTWGNVLNETERKMNTNNNKKKNNSKAKRPTVLRPTYSAIQPTNPRTERKEMMEFGKIGMKRTRDIEGSERAREKGTRKRLCEGKHVIGSDGVEVEAAISQQMRPSCM